MTLAAYNASKRTFGVELEGANISVPEARAAFASNPALAGWRITTDGTAGVTFEAVSPILNQDENGFRSVREACDTLNDAGAEVNVKCGLHVHIGVSDFTAVELASVVNRYNFHSSALDMLVSQSRRRSNNHFCRDHESKIVAGNNTARQLASGQTTRYRKMNLRSFLAHGTIENRHHQGTLNSSKVINWVKLVAIQIEVAKAAANSVETVEAPAAVQEMNLRGNMKRIVDHLGRNGQCTTSELMEELGVTKNTLQSTITRLRRKGYNVRFQNGRYRVNVATPAATTPTPTADHSGLWEDVPEELATYYTRRMTALGTSSRTPVARTQFA